MKEKKKTARKSICKTTKRPMKPLANVLKKAAAGRADLVKEHVNAKRMGGQGGQQRILLFNNEGVCWYSAFSHH